MTTRAANEPPVHYLTDVAPLFTKLGCNAGGCHGKASGQNGFKLSLLGFEPEFDYSAVVKEARGRRLFPAEPERSLLLLKATSAVPHGGGKRLDENTDDYRVLLEWVMQGAPAARSGDPVLQRIAVTPREQVLAPQSHEQLTVTAYFSDGGARDVTRQAVYYSNAEELAGADAAGLVSTQEGSGLFTIMARFGDQIDVFHGTVPYAAGGESESDALAKLERELGGSIIDGHLIAQWRRLRIEPSPRVDDAAFLRRVSIDVCGTLPTPAELSAYVADTRPDKKARLIDRLLERPEYASYFALKWADILRNRGRGYSTSRQRAGTALFSAWIRDAIATNKPYDRFVAEILTATGAQDENPPTVWYRSVRTTTDYVESVAQAFLGVRIQCAQCHHHPLEQWSQDDYYGLAAFFARIGRKGGFADAEVPTNEVIFVARRGEVEHPRTRELVHPRTLDGEVLEMSPGDDPRRALATWMTAPENPLFARTMVNRMWGHFFGRGIIEPIDDYRSSNPPSNPELLHALAQDFAASGYDVKQLVRTICSSYAYGLSSAPTEHNRGDQQSFARYYPRRMKAEVLLDAISQVLEVPTVFPGGVGTFPLGTRAIELPDEDVPAHFLDVFGRPARTTACECERVDAPALSQALELVNSAEIQRKLSAAEGYVERLAAEDGAHEANVSEVFRRVFARAPRPAELAAAVEFLKSQTDRREAYRSLVWSLLATNEFLFNH